MWKTQVTVENYVENPKFCGKLFIKLIPKNFQKTFKKHLTTIPTYDILQLQSNETLTLKH